MFYKTIYTGSIRWRPGKELANQAAISFAKRSISMSWRHGCLDTLNQAQQQALITPSKHMQS
jgi:hypothetical protein